MKNLRLLIGFPAWLMLTACQTVPQVPPNILFILADDYSADALGALGNREVVTPNIDDLARQGMLFSATYNMGGWNGAICIASRTMLNTGRFLWHAERAERFLDSLAEDDQLWSREMADLGYETYFTGKWHVNIDPAKLFHHVGTIRPGMPADTPEGYDRPKGPADTTWTPWNRAFGGYWEGGIHWSEVVAGETVGFLEQATQSESPFFIYVAFNAPHDPRQSPRGFVELYPVDSILLPENYLPEYPYKDQIGCGPSLRDEALAPFPRTPYAVRVHRSEYYALISHLDAQIGRILQKLKETGLSENTIVIFTADHGLSVGHHGLMGKQNMYQHSLCPPLIIAGPGIPAGSRRDAPVYLQDLMPTSIELAGGDIPSYVEFHSLRPLLEGADTSSYSGMYGAYMDQQRMIREEAYKLMVYPKAGVFRLFNLKEDRLEIEDLAGDPGQQARIESMVSDLTGLMRVMGDTLTLPPLR